MQYPQFCTWVTFFISFYNSMYRTTLIRSVQLVICVDIFMEHNKVALPTEYSDTRMQPTHFDWHRLLFLHMWYHHFQEPQNQHWRSPWGRTSTPFYSCCSRLPWALRHSTIVPPSSAAGTWGKNPQYREKTLLILHRSSCPWHWV